MLAESMPLAKARTALVAEALVRLGVPSSKPKLESRGNPQPIEAMVAPGPEATKRRVVIRVTRAK
jgi:outer membrane protein OmpA-like peptidoglycan-associated protein